jgi:hypothetical protein
MKGGSATAVLLDAVCLRALMLAQSTSGTTLLRPSDTRGVGEDASIARVCLAYQSVHSETYCSGSQRDALPSCMRQAAESLRAGGRVLYVGAESAGCMAFIDASEMPDTYGSPFDQIRGFVEGGWGAGGVGNASGDIAQASSLHRISYDDFRTDILPTLCDKDTVVVVAHNGALTEQTLSVATDVQQCQSPIVVLAAVNRSCLSPTAGEVLTELVNLSSQHTVISLSQDMEGLFDYSLKLLLNAVSTYAQVICVFILLPCSMVHNLLYFECFVIDFILLLPQAAGRGAVHKGLMVTTGPANDKIYNR